MFASAESGVGLDHWREHEQLTRNWAVEFGLRGVRVNPVAPGGTLAPGNEAFRGVLDHMTASTPAGVVVQANYIGSPKLAGQADGSSGFSAPDG